jgi:hypothetical protein
MNSTFNGIPVLKAIPTYIEAAYYNRVRIALNRVNNPLRLALSNLQGLDIVLQDDIWLCVDRSMNDLPILAWTDFNTRSRNSILESVPCQLRFFHSHADLVCGSVLGMAERQIEEQLAQRKKLKSDHCEIRYIRKFR